MAARVLKAGIAARAAVVKVAAAECAEGGDRAVGARCAASALTRR